MNSQTSLHLSQPLFEELINQICDSLQSGIPVDIERIAREHPEFAESLRNLYPTLLAVATLDPTNSSPLPTERHDRQPDNEQLGDFRIIRQIGRGGMGIVFEAQQLSIRRKVALKTLPLASLVDHRALQRFKNEVTAIATLEHPHIVSVYAVGEDRGIHYYAMQLIRGQSLAAVIRELRSKADQNELLSGEAIKQAVSDIDKQEEKKGSGPFCAQHPQGRSGKRVLTPFSTEPDDAETETVARGRSNTARGSGDPTYFRNVAKLICQAAEGIQHAHEHGIVHRDIKPGNLLLDSSGKLFVTDFGLARIETGAGVTMAGDMLGTLRYMSPEQVLGNRVVVDHRTDVYSLGATLYELLTLQPMWTGEDKAELIRQISFDEPTRPQRINPAIPTDLETIVLKAISKSPFDRYVTAVAFAADLGAYLANKSISARRPTLLRRSGKWAQRNSAVMWSAFAILIVVVASMVFGIVGLSISNSRIREEQTQTLARVEELKLVTEFQGKMLAQVDPSEAGRRLTEDVIAKFQQSLRDANVPDVERQAQLEEFEAQWKNINATEAARGLIERTILKPSVETVKREFVEKPQIDAHLRQVLADIYRSLALYDAALPLQVSALTTRRELLGNHHLETLTSITSMGALLLESGDYVGAERFFNESIQGIRQHYGDLHPALLEPMGGLGSTYILQARWDDALLVLQQHIAKSRLIVGDDDRHTIAAIHNLALMLLEQRKLDEAEPLVEEAVERFHRVYGDEDTESITSLNTLGMLREAQGRSNEAEQHFRQALERKYHVSGSMHPDIVAINSNLGSLLMRRERVSDAEPFIRKAMETARDVLGDTHPDTYMAMGNLASLLEKLGRLGEAEPLFREVLKNERHILGEEHPNVLITINNLASLLCSRNSSEAVLELQQAIPRFRRVFGNTHEHTIAALGNLGKALQAEGKLDEADPYYREALQTASQSLGETHPHTITATASLGDLLQKQGKLDEAEHAFREVLEKVRQVHGDRHPKVWKAVDNVAQLLKTKGQMKKAESLYRENLDTKSTTLGERHPETLSSLNNLGVFLKEQKKLAAAEPLMRQALEGRRQVLGEMHFDTIISINNFGSLMEAQGKLNEAETYYREAIDKARKCLDSNPNSSAFVGNLGALLKVQGKFIEAEPYLREAYEKRDRSQDLSQGTFNLIASLAKVYWDTKQLDKSIPLYEELLTLQETSLGRNHPYVQTTLLNLGINYKDAGRISEAIPLLEEGFEFVKHQPSVNGLGDQLIEVFFEAGESAKAKRVALFLLDQSIANLPPDSEELSGRLALLCMLYFLKAEEYEKAEELLRQSLGIREAKAPNSWTTFNTQSLLGEALFGQEKFDEAEHLLLSGCQGMIERGKHIPPNFDRVGEAMARLIQLYESWHNVNPEGGYAAKSMEWREKLEKHNRDRQD